MSSTTSKIRETQIGDGVCPICLRGDDEEDEEEDNDESRNGLTLVSGSCGHRFCLPCIQRVFAASRGHTLSIDDPTSPGAILQIPTQDDILDAPTMGRCPICRGTLCLLDLRLDGNTDARCDERRGRRPSHSRMGSETTEERPFAVPRECDITKTELAGSIFVKKGHGVGELSIHFPSTPDHGSDHVGETTGRATPSDQDLPFFDLEKAKRHLICDDGFPVTADKKRFLRNSIQYHKDTRTFRGTIQWDVADEENQSVEDGQQAVTMQRHDCGRRLRQSSSWDCVMSFSSDFRYVAKGMIIKKRDPCRRSTCSRPNCKFLLDGEWTVTWTRPPLLKSAPRQARVHGNRFVLCSTLTTSLSHLKDQVRGGSIRYDAHDSSQTYTASLVWHEEEEGVPVCQKASSSFKLKVPSDFNGPAIGERIEWLNYSEGYPSMVWRRETVAPDDLPLGLVKLCGVASSSGFYHRLGATADQREPHVPVYNSESLWGNVFLQALTVGMASYHFLEEEGGAYISYEHERTSVWPNLDNGQPIPSRIYFNDASFDPDTNIFRGKIDWEGVHGTSWNGSRYWTYEILFARDFSCIVGGAVYARQHGSTQETAMSTFGDELLYLNAGCVEEMKDEAATDPLYSFSNQARRNAAIKIQMEDIGAPAERIDRLQSMFNIAQMRDISYPSTTV